MESEDANFNSMDQKTLDLFNQLNLKELTSYPLFMNEIDLSNNENEDVIGLKQLLEQEETAEEKIGDWKNQGNSYFSTGQKQAKEGKPCKIWYLKALKCYTIALDENQSDDSALVATLLSNRAAVNLLLGNYGRVVEDCQRGIALDASNVKLYFRAAKASFTMYKYAQAVKFCDSGLAIQSDSKDLIQQKQQAMKKLQEAEKKKKLVKNEHDQIVSLKKEITSLNIQFGDYLFANIKHFMKDSKIHRDAEGVKWPTIFIYEEYKQIDFIQAFGEDTTFGQHLQVMFPPGEFCEWDLDRTYSLERVEVYAILNQVPPHGKRDSGKPRKVRLKHTTALKTILTHPEYVIPGIPVFYLVSTVGDFKEQFLKAPVDKLSQGRGISARSKLRVLHVWRISL